MKNVLLLCVLLVLRTHAAGQPPKRISIAEYIGMYKEDAIKDMMRMGVPASITLAQGILESESGNSDLARYANNHFGIKCHKEWTGETYHKDDDAKDECFRKYNSVLESFDDHGRFLRERSRYAFLFDYEITDYKSWAHGLKKAGYATNPRYADLLIKLIEEHELHRFDAGGKNIPVTGNTSQATPPAATPPKKETDGRNTGKPDERHSRVTKPGVLFNASNVPYVVAGKNDTWLTIAMTHDMRLWQILKYNDAGKEVSLEEGDIVYLKPKRGRAKEEFHIVQVGESLRHISQVHGIKLNRLIKLNGFEESIAVQAGQKIKLR